MTYAKGVSGNTVQAATNHISKSVTNNTTNTIKTPDDNPKEKPQIQPKNNPNSTEKQPRKRMEIGALFVPGTNLVRRYEGFTSGLRGLIC